jgi:protein-tyrosine-phosphatase
MGSRKLITIFKYCYELSRTERYRIENGKITGVIQMKKVLFVCVENAGRSQIAEAFAKAYGKGKFEAKSAGTMPAREVNPQVVQVMREKGIDLSANRPKLVTNQMVQEADMIVVMGGSTNAVFDSENVNVYETVLNQW